MIVNASLKLAGVLCLRYMTCLYDDLTATAGSGKVNMWWLKYNEKSSVELALECENDDFFIGWWYHKEMKYLNKTTH